MAATDITRYRAAGGAICRLIRVIRWFGDNSSGWPSALSANAVFLPLSDKVSFHSPVSRSVSGVVRQALY